MCVCMCLCLKNLTRNFSSTLVHVFSAAFRAATARNLVVFDVKFVVVRKLLAGDNSSKGKDDDVLLTEDVDDFRVAVRLKRSKVIWGVNFLSDLLTYVTRVINEPRRRSTHRRVHHQVVVDFEHVAADAFAVVVALAFVGQRGADEFSRVFYHHLTWELKYWELKYWYLKYMRKFQNIYRVIPASMSRVQKRPRPWMCDR